MTKTRCVIEIEFEMDGRKANYDVMGTLQAAIESAVAKCKEELPEPRFMVRGARISRSRTLRRVSRTRSNPDTAGILQ